MTELSRKTNNQQIPKKRPPSTNADGDNKRTFHPIKDENVDSQTVKNSNNGSLASGSEASSNELAQIKRARRDEGAESKLREPECPIQVFIRCRGRAIGDPPDTRVAGIMLPPESNKELQYKPTDNARGDWNSLTFDRVYAPTDNQRTVFNEVVNPIINQVLDGYSCTIFAYGQTGTGKTYTMEGSLDDLDQLPGGSAGIIPRTLFQLFDAIEREGKRMMYVVKLSMLEIYNEDIFDLLAIHETGTNPKLLPVRDSLGNLTFKGLEQRILLNAKEGISYLKKGSMQRHKASTKLNTVSSRSHYIFTLTVHKSNGEQGRDGIHRLGKLNLVDLAGSEDIGRSGAIEMQALEAGKINQSLLALGKVISRLYKNSINPPGLAPSYRESKLTRILEDSLSGGTRTCIIATISLALADNKETVSTLKYASQAKAIITRPKPIVSLPPIALYQEYRLENAKLKSDLELARNKEGVYILHEDYQRMVGDQQKLLEVTDQHLEIVANLEEKNSELLHAKARQTQELSHLTSQLDVTKSELEKSQQEKAQVQLELEQNKAQLKAMTQAKLAHESNQHQLATVAHKLLQVIDDRDNQISQLKDSLAEVKAANQSNALEVSQLKQAEQQQSELARTQLKQLHQELDGFFSQINRGISDVIVKFTHGNHSLTSQLKQHTNKASIFLDQVNVTNSNHQNHNEAGDDAVHEVMSDLLNDLNEHAQIFKSQLEQAYEGWLSQSQTFLGVINESQKTFLNEQEAVSKNNTEDYESQKKLFDLKEKELTSAYKKQLQLMEDKQRDLKRQLEETQLKLVSQTEALLVEVTRSLRSLTKDQTDLITGILQDQEVQQQSHDNMTGHLIKSISDLAQFGETTAHSNLVQHQHSLDRASVHSQNLEKHIKANEQTQDVSINAQLRRSIPAQLSKSQDSLARHNTLLSDVVHMHNQRRSDHSAEINKFVQLLRGTLDNATTLTTRQETELEQNLDRQIQLLRVHTDETIPPKVSELLRLVDQSAERMLSFNKSVKNPQPKELMIDQLAQNYPRAWELVDPAVHLSPSIVNSEVKFEDSDGFDTGRLHIEEGSHSHLNTTTIPTRIKSPPPIKSSNLVDKPKLPKSNSGGKPTTSEANTIPRRSKFGLVRGLNRGPPPSRS